MIKYIKSKWLKFGHWLNQEIYNEGRQSYAELRDNRKKLYEIERNIYKNK